MTRSKMAKLKLRELGSMANFTVVDGGEPAKVTKGRKAKPATRPLSKPASLAALRR
jgi:hypothetical protein